MKNRKRVFKTFQYRECEAFAEYLRKQSQQGWHFKEWQFGLVFERGKPKDIIYDVEVFPKGKDIDTRPEEDAMEFADYCEAAGWKLIDGQRKFCIFRRETDDAVPIVTPEERLQNVWKAESNQLVSQTIVPVILTVQYWIEVLFGYSAENWLLSNLMVWMLFGMTFMAGCSLLSVAECIIWKMRAKKKLKDGKAISYGKRVFQERWMSNILLLGILIMAYLQHETVMFSAVAITLGALAVLTLVSKIFRPSRNNNWGIQIGGSFGITLLMLVIIIVLVALEDPEEPAKVNPAEVPLSGVAFIQPGGKVLSAEGERKKSILAEEWSYSFTYEVTNTEKAENKSEIKDISYQIYMCKYDWVTDIFWRSCGKKYMSEIEDCTKEWEAEEAVCDAAGKNLGIYHVKYPGRVIRLCAAPSLEKEEIEYIRKIFVEFREG